MSLRLALRPDLRHCCLEDRTLPALPVGLLNPQFIPSSAGNPALLVSGFQLGIGGAGSSGPNSYPGPNWYYMMVGVNSGVSVGTSQSFLSSINLPNLSGAAVGSGANVNGASGGANTANIILSNVSALSNLAASSGSFSSGYNTALSSSNNFGMASTPVGSVAAHLYDTGSATGTGSSSSSSSSSGVDSSALSNSTSSEMATDTGVSVSGSSGATSTSGNLLHGPMNNNLTGSPLIGRGNSLLIGPGRPRQP
jgi:hypothetical protein